MSLFWHSEEDPVHIPDSGRNKTSREHSKNHRSVQRLQAPNQQTVAKFESREVFFFFLFIRWSHLTSFFKNCAFYFTLYFYLYTTSVKCTDSYTVSWHPLCAPAWLFCGTDHWPATTVTMHISHLLSHSSMQQTLNKHIPRRDVL